MEKTHNTLLDRIRLPGETVRLPSGGVFYKNGELDPEVTNGEIVLYPMTTLDEIVMKTPDKLLNGTAFSDVFSRCAPQILKPMELFAKDVDFLMVCLRKISYGPTIDLPWTHTNCSKSTEPKEHIYHIQLDQFIKHTKSLDPTTAGNLYSLVLENGQKVVLQPPKIVDVIKLYQSMDAKDIDVDALHRQVILTVSSLIYSVEGVTDRANIQEWTEQLQVGWIHKINDSIEKISNWGTSFDTSFKCEDCGEEIKTQIPLNPVAFFS